MTTQMLSTAPIFQTLTVTGECVSVAIETHASNTMPLLVVRGISGEVTMALPVVHVSRAILSCTFDEIDSSTILARIAE